MEVNEVEGGGREGINLVLGFLPSPLLTTLFPAIHLLSGSHDEIRQDGRGQDV
jgi:hypothetical protein